MRAGAQNPAAKAKPRIGMEKERGELGMEQGRRAENTNARGGEQPEAEAKAAS